MILAMILCDSDCVGVRTAGASPAASSSTSGVVQPRHTPVSHHLTPLTATTNTTNTTSKHPTNTSNTTTELPSSQQPAQLHRVEMYLRSIK